MENQSNRMVVSTKHAPLEPWTRVRIPAGAPPCQIVVLVNIWRNFLFYNRSGAVNQLNRNTILIILKESIDLSQKDAAFNSEELSKKIDQMIHRLDLLEKLILEKHEYKGVAAALGLARAGIGMCCCA